MEKSNILKVFHIFLIIFIFINFIILVNGCAPTLNDLIIKKQTFQALQKIENTPDLLNLKKPDKKGLMPIHNAAEKGEYQVVSALLNRDIAPDIQDNSGKTPLHYAAECYEESAINVINILLEHSANIEARDNSGWTPLMNAAHHSRLNVVNRLLELGAKIDAKNNKGQAAIHLACQNFIIYQFQNLTKLVGMNSTVPAKGYNHLIEQSISVIKTLLNAGADINALDFNGESPIFYAVNISQDYKLLQFLIKNGAKLSIINHKGQTPLQFARELNKIDIELFMQTYSSK